MDLKNIIAHFAILKPKYPISQLDSGKLNSAQYEVVLVESEGSGKLPRATKELPSFILSRDILQKSTQLLSIVSINVLDKIGPGSNAKRCIVIPVEITEKDRQVFASSNAVQPLRPTSMLQNENVSPTQKTAPPPLGPKPKISVPPPMPPSRTPIDGISSENVLFVVPISPEFTTPDNPPSVTNVVKNATLPHFYTLNLALEAGDKGRGAPFTSSKSTLFFLKRIESWLEDRILVPGAIEKLFAEVPRADTMPWKNPLFFQETAIPPPSPNSKSNNTFANFTNNSTPPVSPSANGANAQTHTAAAPRNTVDFFVPNPRFLRKKAQEKLDADARASGSFKGPATPLVQSTNEPEQLPPVSSVIRAMAAVNAPSPGSTSSQQKPASVSAGVGASGAPTTGAAASSGVSTGGATATATGTVKSGSKSETKSESVSIEMHDKEEESVVIAMQASTQEAPRQANGTPRLQSCSLLVFFSTSTPTCIVLYLYFSSISICILLYLHSSSSTAPSSLNS